MNKMNIEQNYYYWSNKNDINKLLSIKNNEYYLPCYPCEQINYSELIDKDVLIFFRKPKIIYGTCKIKLILIKESEFNYLNSCDEQNTNQINSLVIIDNDLFLDLINSYSMIYIPGVFFMKFDTIEIFEPIINLNKFNNYIKENSESEKNDFKYPNKIKEKNIVKSYNKLIWNNLKNYINYLKNQTNNNIEINKIEILNDDKKIQFNIPILLNGCEEIKNDFINLTIRKKKLLKHYLNCELCEKIDNNNKILKFNKKIVIKKILNNDNQDIFDEIIYDYQNLQKFIIKNNNNFEFNEDKINIVYNPISSTIYSKCVFILNN